LSESLELGGATGALAGVAAVAAGQAGVAGKVQGKSLVIGAEIGSLLGLTMSYVLHRAAENSRRLDDDDKTEMYFGDVPPSPFVFPSNKNARKGR
jgi:hypothetical protein